MKLNIFQTPSIISYTYDLTDEVQVAVIMLKLTNKCNLFSVRQLCLELFQHIDRLKLSNIFNHSRLVFLSPTDWPILHCHSYLLWEKSSVSIKNWWNRCLKKICKREYNCSFLSYSWKFPFYVQFKDEINESVSCIDPLSTYSQRMNYFCIGIRTR